MSMKPEKITMTEDDKLRLLAEIKFHRALERAHGDYAQSIAGVLGKDVVDLPALRGPVQRRIVSLSNLATIKGMSAAEIASALDYDEANTYTTVKGLEKIDMVEIVEESNPRRWRLTTVHRRNRVLRLSRLIPAGSWTTYGEFSIAVYGNWQTAITVGQLAAKNPAFANPHRVLKSGGIVPPDWHDDQGGGSEECKKRLAEEGVWLAAEDRADESFFLGWEELKRLLETAEANEDLEQSI
jgi:alkylated DNA nucleotide flippase Atl1